MVRRVIVALGVFYACYISGAAMIMLLVSRQSESLTLAAIGSLLLIVGFAGILGFMLGRSCE